MKTPDLTAFPFRQTLSVRPLIEFWQSVAGDGDASSATFVDALTRELDHHENLAGDGVSLEELIADLPLIDKLMSAVFPMATMDRHIAAAILPFELQPFYATPKFSEVALLDALSPDRNPSCDITAGEMLTAKTVKAYHLILDRLYEQNTEFILPFVIGSQDQTTGVMAYYQIDIDPRFVRVRVRGQKPELTADEITELLDDPTNVAQWMRKLPPERFEFSGFSIIRATDVTEQQALTLITNDLLDQRDVTDSGGLDALEGHLRSFLRIADVKAGVIAVQSASFEEIEHSRVIGRSLLLSDATLPQCPERRRSAYAKALEQGRAVFIPDLAESCEVTGFEYHVSQLGFASLAVLPLRDGQRTVGLLELASATKGAMSSRLEFRLAELTPVLGRAIKRSLEEREDRIQSVIKKQYTAIHPVVEWRFRNAALAQLERGGPAVEKSESIVFREVYPFYGLSDVRNSSALRAEAIRADLVEQLGLALAVVIEAAAERPQPALDEMGFRLQAQIEQLTGESMAREDAEPLRLLQEDVEPLLDELALLGPGVSRRVEEYRSALDEELGVVYSQRKDFETSITRIGEGLSRYLEVMDEEAQKLVPHYFEKYRTDGVDYNIYAGASLHADSRFEPLDLRNLRLWQLTMMAGCAWKADSLKESIPVALEVTHLVLAQSQPLSIRFRSDEKKFDVDGAYNIRYEIVKKRIDKAVVQGTGERLTQPGKIAVVFTLASEEREYRMYFDYLQAAGYFESDLEVLDLEPMQGVNGLRALRFTVRPEAPESDFLVQVLSRAEH